MPDAGPLRALLRRSRLADWGVHIGVFSLAAAAYALAFDRLPAEYGARCRDLVILQLLLYPAAYLLNDYADFEGDRWKAQGPATPRRRPPRALIALLFAAGLTWAGFAFPPRQLGWPLLFLVAAVAYSVPPVRLKERGLAGVGTAALSQRIIPFLMLATPPALLPLPATLLLLYLAGVGLLFILHHQREDLEFDRAAGFRTWGVVAGRARLAAALGMTRGLLLASAGVGWLCTRPHAWPGSVSPRFAASLTALTALALGLFRLRYGRPLPDTPPAEAHRRAVAPPAARRGPVRIIGAGPAGLVAGIRLLERGIEAEVHAAAPTLGGVHADMEGLHFTHVDPDRLSRRLGLPVAEAFTRIDREVGYQGESRYVVRWRPAWLCRRGGSAGTLDRLLLDAFEARGGTVRFSSRPDWRSLDPAARSILATGLAVEPFRRLGLPCRRVLGCHATGRGWPGTFVTHCRDPRLGRDFAYFANVEGAAYALVFSRDALPEGAAEHATGWIRKTAGVEMTGWRSFAGAIARQPRLHHDGYILAGSLAGMIDPFYLGGLSGALLSGALAALAVEQPDLAEEDFRRLCRNWGLSSWLSERARRHLEHPPIYLGAALLNGCLRPVGAP